MTRTKISLFNFILLAGLALLLCGEVYFGYKLHALSSERTRIKEDYSLSNSVTFGLFSVDQWRDRISGVLSHQVQDYQMTAQQKEDLRAAVEKQLHALVATAVAGISKPQKSIGGKLKKMAFNSLVDSDSLQAQVKPFAQTIMAKVTSPASQQRLKNIAGSKIGQLEKQTYDSTSSADYAVTQYLHQHYRVNSSETFNNAVKTRLGAIKKLTYTNLAGMLGCVTLAIALWWLLRKQVHLQTPLFILALLFAFVLLVIGSTASVIEVDARISSLNFSLLGEKVVFQNQVLFFQSKSIMGIIITLIGQSKPDAVAVGVLILLFVIILPLARLIARGIHILSTKGFAQNKVVRYLAFESSKWDMSDVMIVGLIMTYIGLNGILKSQLSDLNIHSGSLNTETANGTALQAGYFVFAAYVLFAWSLSYILKRITPHKDCIPAKKVYRRKAQ